MKENEHIILIIDDIPQNIEVAANILKVHGFKIAFALNGKTALELCKHKKIDIILLDLMMPEIDGYEVCRQLKQDEATNEIPVLFLTAKFDIDSISKGFEAGGADYITKPFYAQELLARINTHLALSVQKRKLNDISATKNKLFSIIAHDLKSPFNTILGFSELLLESIDNKEIEPIERFGKIIQDSSRQAYNLLINLLEWAQSQTGIMLFKPENIVFSQILDEVIKLLGLYARQKNIRFVRFVDPELLVIADKNMLQAVLRNLISNSIKYTHYQGEIKIKAIKNDRESKISISDNGIGIKNKDIAKLFKLEHQFSTKGTNQEQGTGLGLLLCKEFIEKHNGQIWVESKENQGSTFYFTLPVS